MALTTVHPTCSAIGVSQWLWYELLSFVGIDCEDVCLLSSIIQLDEGQGAKYIWKSQ